MNRTLALVLLFAAGVALVLRGPQLDRRPMHNDEAVNAVKFGQLWTQGTYRYDPNEHHGPSLYYASLALGRLTGAPDFDHYSENRLRLVAVLFGFGLVLLLPLVADGLGRRGTAWAALFTAVSPAMVFYSRYYIHEVLLVFFAFLALAAGWRYWRTRRLGWALLTGLGIGLMGATKETFVLSLAAAGLAIGFNQLWNRLLDASALPVKAPRLNRWHLLGVVGVWFLVWLLLFSSFFANFPGLLDSARTYQPWFNRAAGESPHNHAWYFYLHRLLWFHAAKGPVWTEALIAVLALVAAFAGFTRKQLGHASAGFVRFLAFYTLVLTALYSLIPYKTPWCLLGFWHGMILLAGVGAGILLHSVRKSLPRLAVGLLLLAGAGHLAWQGWQLSVPRCTDRGNPYAYAQTSPDLLNLVAQLDVLAQVHPQHQEMLIKVMTSEGDCWPLPWYLRRFKQVGWWDALPADPFAPVMIVSADLKANLDQKKTHVMVRYYELRPQVFLELYIQLDLWRAYLEKHPVAERD